MARTLAELPKGARITDFVSLGVLTEKFPRTTIDRILQETGRASKRERNLPAHVVVYYVIALALYGQVSYGEVLRCLLEGLEWLGLNVRRLRGTAKSAITQARSRLGKEPLQRLYQEVVSPIATPQTQGAWYRGRRLVTLDGSTLDLADTAANEATFGRPGASRGRSGYPQLRFVALLENGTHVLFATEMGGYGRGEARSPTGGGAGSGDGVFGRPEFFQLRAVEAVPRRRQPPVVAREKEPEAALSGAFVRWLLSEQDLSQRQGPQAGPRGAGGSGHRVSTGGNRRTLSSADDLAARGRSGRGAGRPVSRALGDRDGAR